METSVKLNSVTIAMAEKSVASDLISLWQVLNYHLRF